MIAMRGMRSAGIIFLSSARWNDNRCFCNANGDTNAQKKDERAQRRNGGTLVSGFYRPVRLFIIILYVTIFYRARRSPVRIRDTSSIS